LIVRSLRIALRLESAPRIARDIGADGYRFAKPHGKLNSANCATIR
jgi:hypothetical protein